MKRARSQEAKDERRELLLNAALEVFFENGFMAARMDDIAARANLSKGTLYLYFSSKEDLFNGLVEIISTPRLNQLRSITAKSHGLVEALDVFADFAPELILKSDVPKLMKIMLAESQSFPQIADTYRKIIITPVLSVFEDILTKARSRGEVTVDPTLGARLIIAPVALSGLWRILFMGNTPDSSSPPKMSPSDAKAELSELFKLHVNTLKAAWITKS